MIKDVYKTFHNEFSIRNRVYIYFEDLVKVDDLKI